MQHLRSPVVSVLLGARPAHCLSGRLPTLLTSRWCQQSVCSAAAELFKIMDLEGIDRTLMGTRAVCPRYEVTWVVCVVMLWESDFGDQGGKEARGISVGLFGVQDWKRNISHVMKLAGQGWETANDR